MQNSPCWANRGWDRFRQGKLLNNRLRGKRATAGFANPQAGTCWPSMQPRLKHLTPLSSIFPFFLEKQSNHPSSSRKLPLHMCQRLSADPPGRENPFAEDQSSLNSGQRHRRRTRRAAPTNPESSHTNAVSPPSKQLIQA